MRTLSEVIEALERTMNTEEIVDLLEIPAGLLLQRFDDFVERKMDQLQEELFDEPIG